MKDKISVEEIVLAKLKIQEWVTRAEFEKMFPEKVEGHASWGQRLRGLRKKYKIDCRKAKEGKHLFEWHLDLTNATSMPQIKAEIKPKVKEQLPQFFVRDQGQLSIF